MAQYSKKQLGVAIGAIVVVAGIAVAVVLSQDRSSSYTPTTLAATKAAAPANPAPCVAKSDNPDLHIASADQTGILNAVISSIIDIPAGTSVDVFIKKYDDTTASGSARYAGDYGTYNFIATKSKDAGADTWAVKSFVVCKE